MFHKYDENTKLFLESVSEQPETSNFTLVSPPEMTDLYKARFDESKQKWVSVLVPQEQPSAPEETPPGEQV